MARRSYRQHCGLAAALDVVSQRWALLVIRDLAPGARRFSDLFNGLPGISTDMLTDRLRELERVGAVERTELMHPVPATVYQLTSRGHELARISGELARWGAPLLPQVDETPLRRNARWALQSFASRYEGGQPDGIYHIRLDRREDLTMLLKGVRSIVRYGEPDSQPTATLTCTTNDFFDLLTRKDTCADVDDAQVRGDVESLQQLIDTMRSTLRTE